MKNPLRDEAAAFQARPALARLLRPDRARVVDLDVARAGRLRRAHRSPRSSRCAAGGSAAARCASSAPTWTTRTGCWSSPTRPSVGASCSTSCAGARRRARRCSSSRRRSTRACGRGRRTRTARARRRSNGSTRVSTSWPRSACRPGGRSATATRCRRSRTRCGRSPPTRSCSPRTRRGVPLAGARRGASRCGSASTCR